jgi:hypothetical protein
MVKATKNKNTISMFNKERAKLIAQYIGAQFLCRRFKQKVFQEMSIRSFSDYQVAIPASEFGRLFMDGFEIGYGAMSSEIILLLKPLSSITNEDAIEVAKIEGMKKFKIYRTGVDNLVLQIQDVKNDKWLSIAKEWEDCNYSFPIDDEPFTWSSGLSIHSFHYLQSKGYAMPYMQYSVKELVKIGIYELI